MTNETIIVGEKTFFCSVTPAGPVNIVIASNEHGLVGCCSIDVDDLEGFGYAAAQVRPPEGRTSVSTIDDLLRGFIKKANAPAKKKGVRIGMTGKEALAQLG